VKKKQSFITETVPYSLLKST